MIGQGKPALFKFGVARVVVMALGCKGARLQEQLVQLNLVAGGRLEWG